MATEILATGSGAANSADQVLSAGTSVSLKGYDGNSRVVISLKDDAGAYNPVGDLTMSQRGLAVLASGTYRFSRPASSSACGVFSG